MDGGNSRRVEEVGITGQGRMSRWKLGFSNARGGHLEVLKWARANAIPWTNVLVNLLLEAATLRS